MGESGGEDTSTIRDTRVHVRERQQRCWILVNKKERLSSAPDTFRRGRQKGMLPGSLSSQWIVSTSWQRFKARKYWAQPSNCIADTVYATFFSEISATFSSAILTS